MTMPDPEQVNDELDRFFGPTATYAAPSRLDRFRLGFRAFIHPLGIHHPVRTFTWSEQLDRLIDEGKVCRVCGIPRN